MPVGMSKVLIVEDDEVLGQGMASHLSLAGFDPLLVEKGDTGLARLRFERPDVCVLDLMLPGLDGWTFLQIARREGIGTPIIIVSARGSENDRVHALEIGADDYLVKPFAIKEFVARCSASGAAGIDTATGPWTCSCGSCATRSTAARRSTSSSAHASVSATSWKRALAPDGDLRP